MGLIKVNLMVTNTGLGLRLLLSAAQLSLLFSGLRHRRQVEEKSARAMKNVSGKTQRCHALQGEVLAHRAREQGRIAGELHSGVSQNLVGISMLLKGLEQRLQSIAPNQAVEAARIGDLIRKTGAKARDLALGCEHRNLVTYADLPTALRRLVEHTHLLFQVPIRFEGVEHVELEPSSAQQLLAIAEDAVTLAVNRAVAQTTRLQGEEEPMVLRLERAEETLSLVVEDAYPVPETAARQLNVPGYRVMAERAENLGGRLTCVPRTPHGIRVECCVSLPSRGVPE